MGSIDPRLVRIVWRIWILKVWHGYVFPLHQKPDTAGLPWRQEEVSRGGLMVKRFKYGRFGVV